MKIPEPRKMSSGNYFIQLRLGGNSYSFTGETKRECKLKAAAFKTQYLNGGIIPVSKLTLRKACEEYIAKRSNVLSPSTIRGYKGIIANRFDKYMDRKMTDIKNWQQVINDEAADCSGKTLSNSWSFIKSVLKENGINVGNVTLPQVIIKERAFLEPDQIPGLIKAVKGSRYELAVLLGLHGLRRSEILGLHKKDVTDGIIHIRGAMVFGENNVRVLKDTNKNVSSRRDVPVMIPRVNELVSASADGLLCPDHPDAVRKSINSICKELGYPQVSFHGLRHSFASLAYYLGLSELETMRLGGWSDPGVMKKIYTHLSERKKNDAVTKLTTFFAEGEKKKKTRVKKGLDQHFS